MNRIAAIMGVLFTVTWCVGSEPAADRVIVVGGFSIVLPASWEKTDPKPKIPGAVAKKYEKKGGVKVCIGEIMAAHLKGSVEKESGELVSSVNEDPKTFKVLETRKVVLQNGMTLKTLLISLMVEDSNYSAPQAFYSVYLPKPDGSCVTFKLRCSGSRFDDLRKEFEDIISKVTQVKAF